MLRDPACRVTPHVLATCVLLLAAVPAVSAPAAPSRVSHRVVQASGDALVIEMTFPPAQFDARDGPTGRFIEATTAGCSPGTSLGSVLLPECVLTLAVPVGMRPRVDASGAVDVDLGSGPPPPVAFAEPGALAPSKRPAQPEESHRALDTPIAFAEPVTVARHVRLTRVIVRPLRYDPATSRWSGVRSIRLNVTFVPQPPESGSSVVAEADDTDRSLMESVANPLQAPTAVALEPGGAAGAATSSIPVPEPSTMTPLKLSVRSRGLFCLRPSDLTAAGIDPAGVDPRTFVLTLRGSEVAIEVTGEADGQFDTGDEVRFFGLPIDSEQTKDNVYRLTAGIRNGLRMATRDGTPNGAHPVPADFDSTAYRETDLLYWGGLPTSLQSPWYWQPIAASSPGTPVFVEQTFTLANLASGSWTGRVEVNAIGRRETPGPSPNHHLRVYLNGHLAADSTWTGLTAQTVAGDVPAAWFVEGTNVVRVEDPADLGLFTQEEWTDWIRVSYDDRYVAEGDELEFGARSSGPWKFQVSGFAGTDLSVYDVTDPSRLVRVTGVQAQADGPTWKAVFSDPYASVAGGGARLALRPGAMKAPAAIARDEASDLRARASTGADLLIVTYDPLFAATQPLVTHRQSQGLRVVAARVTDVLDEFNGGIAEAQGIKNFVEWAFANYASPAPSYLLFVGDATWDPADFTGEGDNGVSTSFYQAAGFGLAPSDNWFACVNGADEVPDLAVGRITARSTSDVDVAVGNLLAYEGQPPVSALNQGLLYVADDDSPSFEALLEDLIARFQPPAMASRRVYLNSYPQTQAGVDQATAAIKAALDAGSLVTTFAGHGNRTVWAGEGVWANAYIGQTSPLGRLTFAMALNCLNGYFVNVDFEPWSLGEQWLLFDDRGSVGSWSPSSLGVLSGFDRISDQVFHQLFDLRETRLGTAAWNALLDAYYVDGISIDYLKDMIYLGDPAAVLPLDSDRDGHLDVAEIQAATDADDADSDDDGVLDGDESQWNLDFDGDGRVNAADHDADDDGLPDGLERGVTVAPAATDTTRGHFIADADPLTVTDPLDADTDNGGAPDGAEDRNANGRVDAGETNPVTAADDPVCGPSVPAEVQGLMVNPSGNDAALTWTSLHAGDPCLLYRVYVALMNQPGPPAPPKTFAAFAYAGTVGPAAFTDRGARADTVPRYYLVRAVSPSHGPGLLGHYGQ